MLFIGSAYLHTGQAARDVTHPALDQTCRAIRPLYMTTLGDAQDGFSSAAGGVPERF